MIVNPKAAIKKQQAEALAAAQAAELAKQQELAIQEERKRKEEEEKARREAEERARREAKIREYKSLIEQVNQVKYVLQESQDKNRKALSVINTNVRINNEGLECSTISSLYNETNSVIDEINNVVLPAINRNLNSV